MQLQSDIQKIQATNNKSLKICYVWRLKRKTFEVFLVFSGRIFHSSTWLDILIGVGLRNSLIYVYKYYSNDEFYKNECS